MGQLSCLNDQKNLGMSSCKKLPQQIKGMITTPDDFSLTFADAADPQEWQDAILAAKGTRIYLWPVGVAFENISEAAVYEETSLADIAVRDGRYKFRLSFQENLNLHKNMFSHQNFQGRVFLIDDKNQLIGTSPDGNNFKGFTISLLNPEKITFNDGSVASKTPVYISLADNLELDENGCLIDGTFVGSLIRLTTVDVAVLSTPAPSATGFVVTVMSALDSEPILGLVVGDFVLLDAVGAAQVIGGVIDNGDGSYTLSGAGLVTGTINLVAASALSIEGYESSGAADVTIP